MRKTNFASFCFLMLIISISLIADSGKGLVNSIPPVTYSTFNSQLFLQKSNKIKTEKSSSTIKSDKKKSFLKADKDEEKEEEEKKKDKDNEEDEDEEEEEEKPVLDYRYKYDIKKEVEDFKVDAEITCTKDSCSNGKCVDGDCICFEGYASNISKLKTYKKKSQVVFCEYKLKEHIVAFLLETFFVIGIGHLYSGRMTHGIVKMLCILLFIVLDVIIKNLMGGKSLKARNGYYSFSLALYFSIIIYQLFDIVMLGLNRYSDGNGMPLYYNEMNKTK